MTAEVYKPESEGRLYVDIHLGGGAQDSSKKNSPGSRACQGAPPSQKEKQEMSLLERFVTEGNGKTEEMANDDAMLDGGGMAQIRGIAVRSWLSVFWWTSGTIVQSFKPKPKEK